MNCTNCGAEIGEGKAFCECCGSPVQVAAAAQPVQQAQPQYQQPVQQAQPQYQQPQYQQPVQQQPQYQQPVQQAQPQAGNNAAASTARLAMIFGCVSMGCWLLLGWIPYIKIAFYVAGIVFAILALMKTSQARSMGSASIFDRLGKIFGIVGLIMNILMTFITSTGWLLGFLNTHF